MPENESRNPRLITHPRVFQSSYNTKDPPKIGSRRGPVSREALLSFSKFLERFYPKALYDYLSRRELHARYERKYDDFRRKELLEAVERKARHTRKLSVPSAEPTTDLVYTLDRSAGPLPSN